MAARARSLGARAVPLAAAGLISVSVYSAYAKINTLRLDDTPYELAVDESYQPKARPFVPAGAAPPFTPLAWGSNAYLTLIPDPDRRGPVRRPTPMAQLGGTPFRDLVIHEKYGAAVDARGDLWMWGAGYDPSGLVGRSLRGKKLAKLAPGPGKLFGLSRDGRLYVVSADRSFQDGLKPSRGYWKKMTTRDPIVDFVELRPGIKFGWGEKFTSFAVGRHHLLAVTNCGRTFSLPLSPEGNSHRQLGTKQTFPATPATPAAALADGPALPPESDPRFATTLTEIPALSGVDISQVAASERSSLALTSEGRVVGFGANDFGQIGLGSTSTMSIIPTPVEVVLAKGYPAGTNLRCTSIAAGGLTTFFTVQRTEIGDKFPLIDVLSCGNGQYGTLGSGMWSSASFAPTRIRALSGLQEYSEKEKSMVPVPIQSLSVSSSPTAHVFAVLDTLRSADAKGVKEGLFGKDVLVWGANADSQLGNGKRSACATPAHLPSLIPHAIDTLIAAAPETTESPIPLTRLQLHTGKADAKDPNGKVIKRGVKCEETVVAGYNCSVLYNKIVE